MKIAKNNNIKVLEDAAEGIGSEFKGKKVGSIGDAGVFSFHGTKTITTGEGGIVVSNSYELIKKIKILNDHGRNSEDPDHKPYWMRNYGYKYKISNIQAALGCAQVERIGELIQKKRKIFNWYKELTESLPVKINIEKENTRNGYWLPTIIFDEDLKLNIEEFFNFSRRNGVDFRPFFYPLSSLPFFKKKLSNINSYKVSKRGINLPSYHEMSIDECKRVIDCIKNFINNYCKR